MKRREFVEGISLAGAAAVLAPRLWSGTSAPPGQVSRLDTGWKFLREDPAGAANPGFNDAAWEAATLPHTARLEALVTGPPGTAGAQWQGACWYRRLLRLDPSAAGQKSWLRFDGAMNLAEVWLDGERIGGHQGGYLPFVVDLGDRVRPGRDHLLAVRLDNRDNPITGPKPLAQLDFNLYSGLYRPVYLVHKNPLHITDPLLADLPASGGVFVTYPHVSRESASVRVQVHVRNDHSSARRFQLRIGIRRPGGQVASGMSPTATLAAGAGKAVTAELLVKSPNLWSPATPDLYQLDCELVTESGVVDAETVRIGIRRIEISREGFRINGEPMFLRGTNRHQEYPFVGNAVSDAAQYRDAARIKAAGFDYVRLSHYPQSPAFMDACDELGLVVMNCIPGWQFFNPDPAFIELQYKNCRDMIRRDRNHPCVILWEVSLNESGMTPAFIARTHAIAHEEYPGDQCFTCGWMKGYDVFIDARQHGGCRAEREQACVVSEYGDWEYYAMNAGLDQAAWQNLTPAESNSRQLRWQGERAQLQQATNFQEAHNDNLATIAFGDGLWVMYDYNRGYSPDIESSGCMDIFRLPKYSYHFFRSQRSGDPMVFIANEWAPGSATDVRVFSNCEEVALYRNGRLVERKGPDQDRVSTRLAHPPFTFKLGGFEAGTLEAVGFRAGRRAARHVRRTPGEPARLILESDLVHRRWDRVRKDTILCHASLADVNGTVLPGAWENVAFGLSGAGRLIGMNPIASDGGIASILLETEPGSAPVSVYALALVPGPAAPRILSGSLSLVGRAPRHQVRPTADGAELLVQGRVVASLSVRAGKFRVPVSAPPEKRDPFRR
jgi:beta-galactosidase